MKKKVVTELEISREAMYKSLDKLLKKWRISSCQTRLVSCTNGSKVRTQISTDSVVIKKLKEFREYLKKTDYPKFNFFNFVKNNRMKVVFRENNVVIKGSTLTNHTELVENFFREASEKKF